jgi:hypothetical protein
VTKANKLEDGEHGTDVSFNYTDKFKSILEEMPAKEEGLRQGIIQFSDLIF